VLEWTEAVPTGHDVPNVLIADSLCAQAALEDGGRWIRATGCDASVAMRVL
jgi:hypothetical protein